VENSRNLTRVQGEVRRHKLLHKGRLPIVSFLSLLPKTEHDATSFTLDLAFTSKTMMTFTVTGVFKERDSKYQGIRHFNR
jgi:nuclear RNA export factor